MTDELDWAYAEAEAENQATEMYEAQKKKKEVKNAYRRTD